MENYFINKNELIHSATQMFNSMNIFNYYQEDPQEDKIDEFVNNIEVSIHKVFELQKQVITLLYNGTDCEYIENYILILLKRVKANTIKALSKIHTMNYMNGVIQMYVSMSESLIYDKEYLYIEDHYSNFLQEYTTDDKINASFGYQKNKYKYSYDLSHRIVKLIKENIKKLQEHADKEHEFSMIPPVNKPSSSMSSISRRRTGYTQES